MIKNFPSQVAPAEEVSSGFLWEELGTKTEWKMKKNEKFQKYSFDFWIPLDFLHSKTVTPDFLVEFRYSYAVNPIIFFSKEDEFATQKKLN